MGRGKMRKLRITECREDSPLLRSRISYFEVLNICRMFCPWPISLLAPPPHPAHLN